MRRKNRNTFYKYREKAALPAFYNPQFPEMRSLFSDFSKDET